MMIGSMTNIHALSVQRQGRQLLQINLGVIRSLRTDGARARLADIIDGPGVSAGNETDEEDEKNELEQDNIKNMESDKEE